MQPTIIVLKSGADVSQGRPQLISNINAVQAIVDILSTTLGPRGMDKLICSSNNSVTISNDGATIIKLLDIVHPAAKTLIDVCRSQDDEVGDGTTSVCLLSGSLLKHAKPFIEDGLHPQIIIRGYRIALAKCLEKINDLSVSVHSEGFDQRQMLERCAQTALNSKLISDYKMFFAPLVVDAILSLDPSELDLNLIGMKKIPGGSVTDCSLIQGVAFKKTFSYAGFEQQPKSFSHPKIVVLNVELELKSEKENAEVRMTNPDQYQSIVDAEWKIIYDKLALIADSGANVILSRLPIGDLATQYFADRDLHCSGRVPSDDLRRVCQATGAKMQTSLQDISSAILGTCDQFEERQIGSERYNVFTGCPTARTATLILRGGAEQFIAETERSLHDAIMIVKRTLQHQSVVGGAGAIEMELSRYLREFASTMKDKRQLIVSAFAHALECIPRQLSQNAGFDSTDVVSELRAAHATGKRWQGVDIDQQGTLDAFAHFIWEPSMVKQNALAAATEAACVILSVDETIRNPKSEGLPNQGSPQM